MSAGGRKVRKTVLSALRKAVSGMGGKCRMKEGRNRRGNVRSGRSGQRWHYGVKGSRVGRGRDAGKTAGWCGRWLRRGS